MNKKIITSLAFCFLFFVGIGMSYTLWGFVIDHQGAVEAGSEVWCYNSTNSNTTTSNSSGGYVFKTLNGSAMANGTYTCNASELIDNVWYENTSTAVTIAGDTHANITFSNWYYNDTYQTGDIDDITIDFFGTVGAQAVLFGALIALAILFVWFAAKGRKIKRTI